MPSFLVKYRVTNPDATVTVEADDRDRAIAQVVEQQRAGGKEVEVFDAKELPAEAAA